MVYDGLRIISFLVGVFNPDQKSESVEISVPNIRKKSKPPTNFPSKTFKTAILVYTSFPVKPIFCW